MWSKETQGIILGAFFWGYLITQIPGGWLSEKLGGKAVLGWCMLLCAISTLLVPVGAHASSYVLVFLRIVAGIGQVRAAYYVILSHFYHYSQLLYIYPLSIPQ